MYEEELNEEKTPAEAARELTYKKKNVYERRGEDAVAAAYDYAVGYAKFLDDAKTEREAVAAGITLAKAHGFVPYRFGDALAAGGRYYYDNRGKNLFLFTIGSESVAEGIRISAAHIDSPRIDLKQVPLYEESGMAFLKTHYYGGIRKYQWVATPLALHGVVVRADGEKINVVIGEDDGDPVLYINDLLPHLGHNDDRKPLGEAIVGEKLNLLIGSRPLENEPDGIKLNVLRLLNEKYGIQESDFLSAELCAVPVGHARDAGLDRSMICAYGHDDRVCAYPAMTAMFESLDSPHSMMCILADKEEVGSDGNTGMQCDLMLDLIDAIAASQNVSPALVRANSKCLSADVSAAFDPNFAEAFEKRNSSLLSCGVVLTKYTGARGKSSTNDASAEYVGWLRGIMEKDDVVWQAGELGKVDFGGGGTVAKFISKHNIEVVDLGVPVISMHAPYEIISKVDLYEAHRSFSAFNRY
ncbi:MAG: aminopeptidase [Clostridia bacterium]|nr:aminopeptidase [Clostridia bacterium]